MNIDFSVHNTKDWFENTECERIAKLLWDNGIRFDYISQLQLESFAVDETGKMTYVSGENGPKTKYRTIIVPETKYMPPELIRHLDALSNGNRNRVIFVSKLPLSTNGFFKAAERTAEIVELCEKYELKPTPAEDLLEKLREILELPTPGEFPLLGSTPLKNVSRILPDGKCFFVSNVAPKFDYRPEMYPAPVDNSFLLDAPGCLDLVIMDPLSGKLGRADWKPDPKTSRPVVRLQLAPNASIIIRTFDRKADPDIPAWNYFESENRKKHELSGKWKLEFISGGPEIPRPLELEKLASWTENGETYENFSGVGKFVLKFDNPGIDLSTAGPGLVRLDLGKVCESARVVLNGNKLGTVFIEPMRIVFPSSLLKERENVLEIEVRNLAANRIRYNDREGIEWKKFRDINVVDIDYKPFDASGWKIRPSGLLGPVAIE